MCIYTVSIIVELISVARTSTQPERGVLRRAQHAHFSHVLLQSVRHGAAPYRAAHRTTPYDASEQLYFI